LQVGDEPRVADVVLECLLQGRDVGDRIVRMTATILLPGKVRS
jgi:hypothetical protein